jgi:2'-5' RNA ligase
MIGIFIEPQKNLKKQIVIYKKKIKDSIKHSIYYDHPPHATIFLSKIKYSEKFENEINKTLRKFNYIKILINRIGVFKNDISTGQNTYFFKIVKNKLLNELQKEIVKICKKKLNKNFIQKEKEFYYDKKLHNNYKKYGYPFVSKEWKPHFTLASCKYNKNKMYKEKLLPKKVRYNCVIKYISIWKIDNQKHKLLKKIKLSNKNA